jgi:hypothetical protein
LCEWKGGGAENLWLKRCRRNERMGEKRERERTNAPRIIQVQVQSKPRLIAWRLEEIYKVLGVVVVTERLNFFS